MPTANGTKKKPWGGRRQRRSRAGESIRIQRLVSDQEIPCATKEHEGGYVSRAFVERVLSFRANASERGVSFHGKKSVAAALVKPGRSATAALTAVKRSDAALERVGLLVPTEPPAGAPRNVNAYLLPFLAPKRVLGSPSADGGVHAPAPTSEGTAAGAQNPRPEPSAPRVTPQGGVQGGVHVAEYSQVSGHLPAPNSFAIASGRAASTAFAGAHSVPGSTAPTTDPTGGQVERFTVALAHGAVWITPTDGAWPGVMPVLRRLAELFSDDEPRLDDNEPSLSIRPTSDIPLGEWPEYIEYLFQSASRQAAELSDSWSRHKEAAQ